MTDTPTLHEGNVLRGLVKVLYETDNELEAIDAYNQAYDVIQSLESTIVRQNNQLREHRAPEPRSRDGREVTRLRHATSHLMDVIEVPDEARDDLVARLSHPVTSPVEVVDNVVSRLIEDTDDDYDLMANPFQPIPATTYRAIERGYN